MSAFKKNIFGSYLTQIVSVAFNFICSILAARMLGAGGQGDLTLYVSFTAFVTLLLGLGLPSAIVHFVASQKIAKQKIIPILSTVSLLLLLVFSGIFFLTRGLQVSNIFLPVFVLKNNLWSYVLVVHLLVLIMNQYFNALLQAENNFISAGFVTALGSAFLFVLYAAKYFHFIALDLHPIYWIFGSLFLVATLQYFILFLKIYKLDRAYFQFRSFTMLEIKPLLIFAIIAYIANIMQFLNYRMDLWFINYFHHNKQMIGVYGLAVTLAQIVWHLPTALHGVLFTFSSSENALSAKLQKTEKSARWLFVYGILAGDIGYLLSIYLVPLWFGNEFADASKLIGILLFGIVPFCYGMGISAFFAGIHKVHINMYASCIGLVACIAFDLLLIPKYGMVGAAYASVISYVASVVFLFFKFRQIRYKY